MRIYQKKEMELLKSFCAEILKSGGFGWASWRSECVPDLGVYLRFAGSKWGKWNKDTM